MAQSNYYRIDDEKINDVEYVLGSRYGLTDSEPTQAIVDLLLADWPEGAEHQAWLDTASADELADWVYTTGRDGTLSHLQWGVKEILLVERDGIELPKARLTNGKEVRVYHDPAINEDECGYPFCQVREHYYRKPFRYDRRHGWVQA